MSDAITIRSSYTLEELEKFKSQAQRRTPHEGNEFFFAMVCATVFAVVAGLFAHAVGAVEDIRNPTVALLCGAAFYAGFLLMWQLMLRKGARTWRAAVEPILARPFTMTIDAQGITLESDGSRKWFAWRRLSAMTNVDEIIVFWFDELQAILLPRRVMSDDDVDRARSFACAGRVETDSKPPQITLPQ